MTLVWTFVLIKHIFDFDITYRVSSGKLWKLCEKNTKILRKNTIHLKESFSEVAGSWLGFVWTYVDGQHSERYIEKSNFFHQTFIEVKEDKSLIWYNKTSNVELSEQRILQVFCTINCCSYNTYLFREIFTYRIFAKIFCLNNFFAKFCIVFALFCFIHVRERKCVISQ